MISIVIPTWNGLELTKNCLNSVTSTMALGKMPYEVIFVDNGSTDGTIKELKQKEKENKRFPNCTRIKLIEAPKTGFAQACNIGIKESKYDKVILLNNDTVVYPHWAYALYDYMEQSKCVIMASTCDYVGNMYQYFPTYDSIKPACIFPNEVNFVCVMIDKAFWNEVKLDEHYISGVEDIDYCWEAIKRGKKVGVCLMSWVHHEGSKTNLNEFGEEKMNDNLIHGWKYFAEKWGEAGKKRAGDYLK